MATSILDTYAAVAGTPYPLATDDSLIITRNGTLVATNVAAIGVSAQGTNINILVDGAIYAAAANSAAIAVSGLSSAATIRIGAAGSIYGASYGASLTFASSIDNAGSISGYIAVRMNGGTAVNSGEIHGASYGIQSTGDGAFVRNTGLIVGNIDGVQLNAAGIDGDGTSTLINAGTILGGSGASAHGILIGSTGAFVQNDGDISGFVGVGFVGLGVATDPGGILVNTGRIVATDQGSLGAAVQGSGLSDSVTNAGDLTGHVSLGAGNDLYDGVEGRQLRGAVFGGDGADTLLGGAGRDVMQGDAAADSLDGGAGDDVLRGGQGADVIEGGEGTHDMLDYAGSVAVNVNLATGDASGGDAAGDVFSGFEWLAGGNFNDVLTGDAQANALFGRLGNDLLSGAAGNDNLVGEFGNDTLIGGAGVDVLRGGVGADVFRFVAASDSGAPGQVRDRIVDFSQVQGDRIDLATIDANAGVALDQAFAFIDTAAFSAAGHVRYQVINGNTFVFGNTDANAATAEFSIVLNGAVTLTAADFIL